MKLLKISSLLIIGVFSASAYTYLYEDNKSSNQEWVKLFDGETFEGWEGDTSIWHIEDSALVGGTMEKTLDKNYFLATKKSYKNFVLKLKLKIIEKEDFANGGVQFRSERAEAPSTEMIGYQADAGDDWWGKLYDESRRNEVLAGPDSTLIDKLNKTDGWKDYKIIAKDKHIQIFINDEQTVDYWEKEDSIAEEGKIGLQIHAGGKALALHKDIYLKELPGD